MGSIKRHPTPLGPISDLFDRLNDLHLQSGQPSVRRVVAGIGRGVISPTTVYNMLAGPKVPAWENLELVVERLGGDTTEFQGLWYAAKRAELAGKPIGAAPAPAPGEAMRTALEAVTPHDSSKVRSLLGPLTPPRNPHFTAREAELDALRLGYQSSEDHIKQVLYGHGGVGKTEIAMEYAHRYRHDYDLVWWIRAEQEDLIRDSLVDLGSHLGLHDMRGGDSDHLIQSTLKALQLGVPYQRSLLVFDNAIRPEVITRYLPQGRTHVLITTQSQGWRRLLPLTTLDVLEFDLDDAVEFLSQRIGGSGAHGVQKTVLASLGGTAETGVSPRADLRDLAEALNGLPLAAEHAAAYLKETEVSVESFLSEFRRTGSELVHPDADFIYPHAVATCCSMTQRILSPGASFLLKVLAMISAEPVSEELLIQGRSSDELPDEGREVLTNSRDLRHAIWELARFSLLKFDPIRSETQIHRVVKSVVEMTLRQEGSETERRYRKIVHILLAGTDCGTPGNDENDHAYEISRPHLIPSGAVESDYEPVRDLVINQVHRLRLRARFGEAFSLAQFAIGRWQKTVGRDHLKTLELASELGAIYLQLGRVDEGLRLNLETMRTLQDLHGSENRIFLKCARSHSIYLRFLGKYQEALKEEQELLRIYRRMFGDDHFEVLSILNNMAISMRCLGRYQEALEYDRHTHDVRLQSMGTAHLSTLNSQFALARDMRRLGHYEDSLEELIKINRIIERRAEPWLLPTLLFSFDLGITLRRVGFYSEALNHNEAMYARHIALVGERHRQTLFAAVNLITDLRLTGKLEEAYELGESTVRTLTEVAGPEHPNTFAAVANLAPVLRGLGERERALADDRKILRGLGRALGEEHPSCLAVMCNLASDLAACGDTGAAVSWGERALALSRRSRGREHPFTLATAANLSMDYQAAGANTPAAELHEETLRSYKAELTPHHPETRAVAKLIRIDLDIEPDAT